MGSLLIQVGQIWWIKFPYSDDPAKHKLRPAAIMGWSKFGPNEDGKILVAAISSHQGQTVKARHGEILINDHTLVGLSKPSYIRPRMLFSIDVSVIEGSNPLGTLQTAELIQALEEIAEMFQAPGAITSI
jgi:hypothetical protein